MQRDARSAVDENGNILLIRFKSIGDILFTLPAVHVIRESFPNAKITFLTSRENVPLIAGFRDVNEVFGIDRRIYHRGNPIAILRESISLWQWLRRKKISLTVDFQGYGETGIITRLSGSPERWGSVYQRARGWAYTRAVQRNNLIHPADWNLSLLQQCGLTGGPIQNEFVVPDSELAAARQFLAAHGHDPAKPTLFIQPFTSTSRKCWPLENFLALARHFKDQGMQILFGGGPSDRAPLAPAQQAGFPVSAGVPLLVTAGLMKLSALIVGGDTGLLHLAVAMNKRVIMLMSSPTRTRCHPFQHADWVLTPPATEAISGITTGAVIEASSRALTEQHPAESFYSRHSS
ncbi:MAG TPA: glycosyltransferase family 9 protein [Verrucomicrobiae bacterium]